MAEMTDLTLDDEAWRASVATIYPMKVNQQVMRDWVSVLESWYDAVWYSIHPSFRVNNHSFICRTREVGNNWREDMAGYIEDHPNLQIVPHGAWIIQETFPKWGKSTRLKMSWAEVPLSILYPADVAV